jgi:hypothetical protein
MNKVNGRLRARIDLGELERLCQLSPTDEELAAVLGVSKKTIQRRKTETKFAEAMELGKAKGTLSLRRTQMKLASEGNVTMLIWLGKQLLGQKDHQAMEHTGSDGGVPQFRVTIRSVLDDPPERNGDLPEYPKRTGTVGHPILLPSGTPRKRE